MKKVFSIVLVFILLAAAITSVSASNDKEIIEVNQSNVVRPTNIDSISFDPRAVGLKDSDEVRIIVELEGKPLIEYATQEGQRIKNFNKSMAKQIREDLKNAQEKVKDNIKSNNIKFKELNYFTTVANGFSGKTSFGEAKKIELMDEVSKVYIANEYSRPDPDMTSSKDIINTIQTWELNYTGEGMVIAIIDTGVDPSHRDMILTNPEKAKLQQEEVQDIISDEQLPGTYRTIKVPYGYNYMDENQEILELGPESSRHGMHVAGIAGANGDEENGGIKGVAPEVQLLAMKVFGNNPAMPSTFGDVIIKAIDDSVLLGADIINMSLGSTAAFVIEDDLELIAIERATENGVLNSISAGNSAHFGNEFDNPYAKNPDIGVVGSPGLAPDSIQVASIENTSIRADALEADGELMGYSQSGPYDPVTVFDGPIEYIYCGLGGEQSDFDGKDLTGKIALIERGGFAFVNKILNAQNNGALGVIIFNHENGGNGLINMMYPNLADDGQDGTIPAVFIGNTNGTTLLSLLSDEIVGNEVVEFNGLQTIVANPDAGKMSSFTSWGVTPNLDFKPEITAPGGQIYSTDQNNDYQIKSGTSMAAPHVSGGAALILQRVDELWPDISNRERVEMTKNLIMSTAKPLGDKGLYNDHFGLGIYNYTSPRRQGAGVMDLYAAATTPTIVVDQKSGISKVNLKEIIDITTFNLTIYNFGDEPVTYEPSGTVQTDLSNGTNNLLETQGVYIADTIQENGPNGFWSGEFPISFSKKSIEVLPGQSEDIRVTIDLSNAVDWMFNNPLNAIFPNGTFIEGFVKFKDINDNAPQLSIPYMGFYGEWDKAPVIDDTNYDENGMPFYNLTTLAWLDELTSTYLFLGYGNDGPDKNLIAFSPNGDDVADTTVPLLSFLRNAREIDINILDSQGNNLRDLAYEEYLRKNYHDGRLPMYRSNDMWTWDGTINNKLAEDGQYIYEVKTRIDYPNSQWQTVTFPVRIDTKAPNIENIEYNKETKILTISANDGEYPIKTYELVNDGQVIAESVEGIFDLSELTYGRKTIVRAKDFAWNVKGKKLARILKGDKQEGEDEEDPDPTTPVEYIEPVGPADGDVTIPTVMITSPEFFEAYNKSRLTFEGYISDSSSIDSFKINGKEVKIKFNTETGNWDFRKKIKLDNGYHSVRVEALDSAGNQIDFVHKVFVDTLDPVVDLTEKISGSTKEESIIIKGTISDNFPDLKVIVNGNMIANISQDWSYFNDLEPAQYELSYEVNLDYGKNTIILEAEDSAGNVTTKKYKINRKK